MAELREKFKSIFDHSPTSSRGVFQVLKSTTRSNPKPKMEPTRRSDRIKLKENIPVYLEENVESKRKSKIIAPPVTVKMNSEPLENLNLEVDKSDKGPPQFVCENCGTVFVFKNSLKKHTRSVHTQQFYSCDICDKTFVRLDSLKRHKVMLHSDSKVAHTCSFCLKHFDYKQNLVKHMKKYHMNS